MLKIMIILFMFLGLSPRQHIYFHVDSIRLSYGNYFKGGTLNCKEVGSLSLNTQFI